MAKKRVKSTDRKPATVSTAAELARWCGVSERTVHTWLKQSGFPVESDGTYSPWNVAQWRILRERIDGDLQGEPGMEGPDSPSLEKWRFERYLMAQMQRKAMSKEYLDRAAVHELMELVGSFLRSFGTELQLGGHDEAFEMWESMLGEIEGIIEPWMAKAFGSKEDWQVATESFVVTVQRKSNAGSVSRDDGLKGSEDHGRR